MNPSPSCAICGELSSSSCHLKAVRLPADGIVLLCNDCSNDVAQLLIDGKEIALEALRTTFKNKAPTLFDGLGRLYRAYRAATSAAHTED